MAENSFYREIIAYFEIKLSAVLYTYEA